MKKAKYYQKKQAESSKNIVWLSLLLFIFLWQLVSWLVANPVLLPGPIEVIRTLFSLLPERSYHLAVLNSLFKICLGLGLGSLAGIALGHLAYFFPKSQVFFNPLIFIFKTAPLAALTIILMIWLKPSALPLVLIVMAVTPPLYYASRSALALAPEKLLEMAYIFRFSSWSTYRYIYLPGLVKELAASISYSSGLAFKAGITGEIMAQPLLSIGTSLYAAKIQLNTDRVLAHLCLLIFLSYCLNYLLQLFLQSLRQKSRQEQAENRPDLLKQEGKAKSSKDCPKPHENKSKQDDGPASIKTSANLDSPPLISVENMTKSYGPNKIINHFSCRIRQGLTTAIIGPSGQGKTSFFRILTGLEEADAGKIKIGRECRWSYAFQDIRLLENLSILDNLSLVGLSKDSDKKASGEKRTKADLLAEWLPQIKALGLDPSQKIKFYSGGMKQKASLIRALAAPSDIIILDETFRELDQESEKLLLELLAQKKGTRTILLASHRQDLIKELADQVIPLN